MDSLFDAILVFILYLLPTKVAARTSVLSKRWRNLWTGVTAVELKLEQLLYSIMSRLTSLALHKFNLITNYPHTFCEESYFKLVCVRKVEEMTSANFTSLSLIMVNVIDKHQVIIDTPKLTYLSLVDSGLLIDFLTNPTEMDTSYIDVTYEAFLRDRGLDVHDVVGNVSKFIVQLCSVREFHLESNVKIFSYMHSFNSLPLFGNLSYATTTLTRRSGVIDVLLFLQIFLNLKEVIVTKNHDKGLQGNNDEVNLVGYILKNASALNELLMGVYVDGAVEDEDARVRKEFMFYKAFFRLPTTPLTTRVVFSEQYLRARNNTVMSQNEIIL
ncbi:hypothetical protein RDABS01_010703, partial [Bienertia sinuspersici]